MRAMRGSLVWRLYAVGMVQLLLVAVAAIVIGMVVFRLSGRRDIQRVADRVEPLVDQPLALTQELDSLLTHTNVALSLYDDEGRLVASNVKPPLPRPMWAERVDVPSASPPLLLEPAPPPALPLFREPRPPPAFRFPPGMNGPPPPPPPDSYAPIEMGRHTGLLVARFEHSRPSAWPPLLTLLSGFFVVGVGALMTARWIARPLERVAQTARALGLGQLNARTELARTHILGEVGHALDEMAERIQKLLLVEKELLANVSHELRTPLARIRVALDLAVEGDAGAARASLAEIAVDLSELETLIDDVLNATRFDLQDGNARPAGFQLHLESVPPDVLCREAESRLRSRHPSRPLAISGAETASPVRVDAVLFRRVIDNLLENAHKYCPDPTRPIELSVHQDADGVRFDVIDHGIGIAPADLPRVFTAFFRGERSRYRGAGGVGLGLTLGKRIVEAHGGAITIRSTLGEGTTVSVLLPSKQTATREQ